MVWLFIKNKIYILGVFLLFSSFFSGCLEVFPEEPIPYPLQPQETPLTIHFIDVGQGDSILVQYKDEAMLVDTGDSDSAKDLVKYLKKVDIYDIDHLVITHPHADHIGGFSEVSTSFVIWTYVDNGYTYNATQYKKLKTYLASHDIQIVTPEVGDILYDYEGVRIVVLNPVRKHSDVNDDSIVLKVTRGNTGVMLTGDIEKEAEKDMLSDMYVKSRLSSDIIKIPHHGGESSAFEPFFDMVNPDFMIISVGEDNIYGHPDEDAMDLYSSYGDILTTSEDGTIIFEIYDDHYSMHTTESGDFGWYFDSSNNI